MHGLIFEIQKDFFIMDETEFGERRTPQEGEPPIAINK